MKNENVTGLIIIGFYASLLIAGVGGYLLGVIITKNKLHKVRKAQTSKTPLPTRTFTRRAV